MVVNAIVELLVWLLPDFILGLFIKREQVDKRKYGEARFDSETGKQILDD